MGRPGCGMNGHLMLEILHAAEILPVGILRPALHRQLVREIEDALEIVQSGHQVTCGFSETTTVRHHNTTRITETTPLKEREWQGTCER